MLLKPYGPVVSFGYQTIALTGLIIGKVKLIQVAECSFHHSLNHEWKMAGAKDRQCVMDWNKQKTVTPIWRLKAQKVVVVVGGYIGMEIAAAAVGWKLDTTTSSGKTYTMSGITEHAVADLFDYIHMHNDREFVLKFSAIEIYNEAVKDFLSLASGPLRLPDDPERGTIVEKLTEEILRDWDHLKELLSFCEAQRQIGETSLNETSSESYQILRLTVESCGHEFLGSESSSTLSTSVEVSVLLRHYQLENQRMEEASECAKPSKGNFHATAT
ncbi:hypothetical protein CsSME_00028951 [Camellia sinensis var. sinensis]